MPTKFTQQTYSIGGGTQLLAADLNGDGKADLILYSGQPSVMLNDGSGHFSRPSPLPMPDTFTYASRIALGDFNNDGFTDIAACVSNTQPAYATSVALSIFLNDRSGSFKISQTIPVPACMGIGTGDVDRDGKPDVVLAYSTGSSSTLNNVITTYFGDGTGHFSSSMTQSNVVLDPHQDTYWTACALSSAGGADFDNDGYLDLVLFSNCEIDVFNMGTVYFAKGDGTGHFLLAEITEGEEDYRGEPEIRDTNHDGKLDFSFVTHSDLPHASSSSEVLLGINDGAGSFHIARAATGSSYGAYGSFVNAGSFNDVNGDGVQDAVVGFSMSNCCPPPTITDGILIMSGHPDGSFSETQRWPTSGTAWSIATADFDGNGTQDIAVIVKPSFSRTDLLVYLNRGN